jgi:uncharacterized protein YyaL (SSP411 family)
MSSFRQVCEAIADAWNERRDEIDDQARRIHDALGRSVLDRIGTSAPVAQVDPSVLDTATATLLADHDDRYGGFGRAPKFPQAMALSFLASQHARAPDDAVASALRISLDAMAAGGIHDHVGGGFARYSVDAFWLVPHFEKMLYDQALLTRAYLRGCLALGEPRWADVVTSTIEYVLRDLRHADGGFFSAEDADSEGEEGRFYVWSLEEVESVCGDDARAVVDFFGVTRNGNFEGSNILHQVRATEPRPPEIDRALRALFEARERRVRPGLDDKVLLEWNALFLRSLVEAAFALERADWMAHARDNTRFLLENLRREDGRLLRSWQHTAEARPGWGADGRARHLAYATDYAALLGALLTLAELDDPRRLDDARRVADGLLELFADDEGGRFYMTGRDSDTLIVRPEDVQDNATPSATSLAVDGLLRLAALSGEARYSDAAERAMAPLVDLAARHPAAFAYLLEGVERAALEPLNVVVVGARDDTRTHALHELLRRRLLPAASLSLVEPDAPVTGPLLEGRVNVAAPTAYVCEGYACRLPVTTPDQLAEQLDAARAGQPGIASTA